MIPTKDSNETSFFWSITATILKLGYHILQLLKINEARIKKYQA